MIEKTKVKNWFGHDKLLKSEMDWRERMIKM